MKPVAVGQSHTLRIATNETHTAAHFGNQGISVIATPVLIGFLESAAHKCLQPSFEAGEGSVGVHVNVRHLAAALPGTLVEAEVTVIAVKGRQVEFAIAVRAGETLLMEGSHGRAVIDLARFFARLGVKPPVDT